MKPSEIIDVEHARHLPGLRLVLTQGVPGPWGEAAKGIFQAKGLPFVRVRQEGGGENAALREWTAQTSAPVAAWNDEPPRTTSFGILFLAERLAPEPRLVPEDAAERVLVLGTCREIVGEQGLGWCRRLMIFGQMLSSLPEGVDAPEGVARMCAKYGWSKAAAAAAPARIEGILRVLDDRLREQEERGREWLFGEAPTAADVYWAAFAAMFEPLPEDVCPMPRSVRKLYRVTEPALRRLVEPRLLGLRDRVYDRLLELPLEF
ncbi:MAG: glutathione S-transferase C-terminal domain-containing protein [Alphaproteobacteria bacterium]